jgi:hypothetical protein
MTNQRHYRMLFLILLLVISSSCAFSKKPNPPITGEQMAGLQATSNPAKANPATPNVKETRQPKQAQPSPISNSPSNVLLSSDFNLILGRPTGSSITASLYTKSDKQIAIAYGTTPGNYSVQTNSINLKGNVPQNIELTNLKPNTTYFYKILSDGIPFGEQTFTTQRIPGSTFTFTIDADPHNRDPRFNSELYATTMSNVQNDHPDFHIDLGDTFMTEKAKPQTYAEAESTFTDMRPYFGIAGSSVPLFLVNGNHEGELGWLLTRGKDKDLPIWSTRLRQLYYPNPTPGGFYKGSSTPDAQLGSARDSYYAWVWGDALFVVLDPFWYTTEKPKSDDPDSNWNWTLGKGQYDWLKSTLSSSQAKYKFVFIHHLVGGSQDARGGIEFARFYEWGGNNANGTPGFHKHRPGWGKPIHQLLVENHVSAVFHGHDHVFVRQDLDGIIYQEMPQPSLAEYNNPRLAADYGYTQGDVLSSSGHLRIIVQPDQVRVEYVRAYLHKDENNNQHNGQVAFSYTIH